MSVLGINSANSGFNPLAAMMARRSYLTTGPKELSPVSRVVSPAQMIHPEARTAILEQAQRALPQLVSQTALPAVVRLESSNPTFHRDTESKALPFLPI